MQALAGMAVARVVKQPDVGQDNGVYTLVDRSIDSFLPIGGAPGLREGVDGQQNFTAPAVGVADALGHGLGIEIVDGSLEGRQATGRADEIG